MPLRDKRAGFEFCMDHRRDRLPGHQAAACHKGIDIYFANKSDAVSNAELPARNVSARVRLGELVATYDRTVSPRGPGGLGTIV